MLCFFCDLYCLICLIILYIQSQKRINPSSFLSPFPLHHAHALSCRISKCVTWYFSILYLRKEKENHAGYFLECHLSLQPENLVLFLHAKNFYSSLKMSCLGLQFCCYVFSCLPSFYERNLGQDHQFFMASCNKKLRTKNRKNSLILKLFGKQSWNSVVLSNMYVCSSVNTMCL